jgi:hypothetical protein
MAKDTIENRVYLFDSLASSYVSVAAELLSSEDEAVRTRARRALAELAYVSCVLADTGHLPPEEVRQRVLGAPGAAAGPVEAPVPSAPAEAPREGKVGKGKKRK